MGDLILMESIGIIGNGVAAVSAVREIHKLDSSIRVDVFSDERHAYYPRPKLIDFIAGDIDEEKIIQYDFDWYKGMNAELHLSESVTRVDSALKVFTNKGEHGSYDRILYAAGSHPWVPPIRGAEKKGMHVLRTLDDALDIRESVHGTGRQIVVGGGILGIELASAMKRIGGEPIVVTNIDTLLPAQLDAAASGVLINRLNEMGLEILLNYMCAEIAGHEHATGVISAGGDKINGDLVVAATGVKPNISLAQECGINCGRGVLVNEYLESSLSNVYAAGDSMEWNGMSHGIIPVAIETAKVAVQNMIEPNSLSYAGTVPSNTLQVAGIDLTSIGTFAPSSPEFESIVSSDIAEGTYFKVVVKDDIVVGGISLGSRKFALKLRGLIRSKEPISDMRSTIFDF